MSGKSVYLIAILVAIISAAVVSSDKPEVRAENYVPQNGNLSHHLIVGARAPGDRLVFRQNVVKKSELLQIVTIEQTFDVNGYETITQLRALDQKVNGNGATACLLKGGPGVGVVTLRFKSLKGHGINFVVDLYARQATEEYNY